MAWCVGNFYNMARDLKLYEHKNLIYFAFLTSDVTSAAVVVTLRNFRLDETASMIGRIASEEARQGFDISNVSNGLEVQVRTILLVGLKQKINMMNKK